jgi:hypothetical protein
MRDLDGVEQRTPRRGGGVGQVRVPGAPGVGVADRPSASRIFDRSRISG